MVVDIDVVLRCRNGGEFTAHAEIVDANRHGSIGSSAAGHGDVPGKVEVAATRNGHIEHITHFHCLARHAGITSRLAVGSKIGAELVASTGPVASVNRVVELHGKTCGIRALAVFFHIIAYSHILNVFPACVEQVSIEVDAACSIGNACRDAAKRAIASVIGTKVPCAVLGIAGKVHTSTVHGLRVGQVKASHGARSS